MPSYITLISLTQTSNASLVTRVLAWLRLDKIRRVRLRFVCDAADSMLRWCAASEKQCHEGALVCWRVSHALGSPLVFRLALWCFSQAPANREQFLTSVLWRGRSATHWL